MQNCSHLRALENHVVQDEYKKTDKNAILYLKFVAKACTILGSIVVSLKDIRAYVQFCVRHGVWLQYERNWAEGVGDSTRYVKEK